MQTKNDFTFWLIFGLSPDLDLSLGLSERLWSHALYFTEDLTANWVVSHVSRVKFNTEWLRTWAELHCISRWSWRCWWSSEVRWWWWCDEWRYTTWRHVWRSWDQLCAPASTNRHHKRHNHCWSVSQQHLVAVLQSSLVINTSSSCICLYHLANHQAVFACIINTL